MCSNKLNSGYFSAFNNTEGLVASAVSSNSDVLLEKIPTFSVGIPQVDGMDDQALANNLYSHPLFTAAMPRSAPPIPGTTFSYPQTNVRKAPYSLNQKKQLKGLLKDTKINDFEITVSPVAHNVNVKCSTGFYTLAVLPSFSGITEQYSSSVDGITIKCNSITGRIDDADSNVNAAIVFALSYNDGTSAGSVHVHLHHSTRRIQLQGSAMVHGQTRAPVWFVDRVLKTMLSSYANTKAVNITKFNAGVQELLSKVSNPSNTLQDVCKACNAQFDGRSTPELCPTCNQKYHRKCFQNALHLCRAGTSRYKPAHKVMSSVTTTTSDTIPASSTSTSAGYPPTVPPIITRSVFSAPSHESSTALDSAAGSLRNFPTSAASQAPVGTAPTETSELSSLPIIPPPDTPIRTSSGTASSDPSIIDTGPMAPPITTYSNLNPSAPPFSNTQPQVYPALTGAPADPAHSQKTSRKKKANNLGPDQNNLELEYTKIELSTRQS